MTDYNDYICETCGYNSMEKPGAYKCPKYGNIMTIANHSLYNNTRTKHDDNNTLTVITFLFGLPACLLGGVILLRSLWGLIPGGILFFILLMLLPSDTKDTAIPITEEYCQNCGVSIDPNTQYCPQCGEKIRD